MLGEAVGFVSDVLQEAEGEGVTTEAAGFLFTEGLIGSASEIQQLAHCSGKAAGRKARHLSSKPRALLRSALEGR